MKQRSIEVRVGLLILVALGILVTFVLVMGQVNLQPKFTVYVDFDNPAGLAAGSAVRIAGVKVGKIDEIQFRGGKTDPTTHKRDALVRAKLTLEQRYHAAVRDNSIFYVTTQGVLGEQFLQIDPGSEDRPEIPDNGLARGLDPPRLDMLLNEGFELLHAGVTALRDNRQLIAETFQGLHDTMQGAGNFFAHDRGRLERIADAAERLTNDADRLLNATRERYIDNPAIARIIERIDSTSAVVARDAEPLLRDAKQTLAHVEAVTGALTGPEQVAKLKRAVDDLAELVKNAKNASADAQAIASHIRHGKGSVGAVVMDEQLYDDIQELARDLKHNPWKFFWRE